MGPAVVCCVRASGTIHLTHVRGGSRDMHTVLLLGAGKIGRMIAHLLATSGDYDVLVGDADSAALDRLRAKLDIKTLQVDADDPVQIASAMDGRRVVVSALSYRHNALVAQAALKTGASYFDLTEDIATTGRVKQIADSAAPDQVFMPQCGLAPGFVSIVANRLTEAF